MEPVVSPNPTKIDTAQRIDSPEDLKGYIEKGPVEFDYYAGRGSFRDDEYVVNFIEVSKLNDRSEGLTLGFQLCPNKSVREIFSTNSVKPSQWSEDQTEEVRKYIYDSARETLQRNGELLLAELIRTCTLPQGCDDSIRARAFEGQSRIIPPNCQITKSPVNVRALMRLDPAKASQLGLQDFEGLRSDDGRRVALFDGVYLILTKQNAFGFFQATMYGIESSWARRSKDSLKMAKLTRVNGELAKRIHEKLTAIAPTEKFSGL